MGFRFFRRIKLAPGVSLNLSKSGPSVSFGPRGAKITVGGSQGTRATAGIPGTGIYYTKTVGKGSGSPARSRVPAPPMAYVPRADRLSMGFFKRMITPDDEEAFVDGLREMVRGNNAEAYRRLQEATHLADGAFLAGMVAIRLGKLKDAVIHLKVAAVDRARLGFYFSKYGVRPAISIPITPVVSAQIDPTLRGILLALAEVNQHLGNANEAMQHLRRLLEIDPADIMMRLSMCELLLGSLRAEPGVYQEVVQLAEDVENESEVHAALLLYKAKALHHLGLNDAASRLLTAILRKRKDRPQELLLAVQYERALVYESMGRHADARSDFEQIYAANCGYEDVAKRLGITKKG